MSYKYARYTLHLRGYKPGLNKLGLNADTYFIWRDSGSQLHVDLAVWDK